MKDTVIISSFKRMEKAINESHQLNQKQIGQLVQFLQSMNLTVDALIHSLIERGIFSAEEMRDSIQKEAARRREAQTQQKANDMSEQPEIETDTSGPTVEADAI